MKEIVLNETLTLRVRRVEIVGDIYAASGAPADSGMTGVAFEPAPDADLPEAAIIAEIMGDNQAGAEGA